MLLVHVLHKELQKRGGWHPEAKYYVQDKSGRICAYKALPVKPKNSDAWSYSNMVGFQNNADFKSTLSSDWSISIIDEVQYFLETTPFKELEMD